MGQLFRAGGFGTDVIGDILVFWGYITTSGNVSHIRKVFTTAGYQVTAGKTLYLTKLRVYPASGTVVSLASLKIGYADNDVGLNSLTARTNPVMAIGVDGTNADGLGFMGSTSGSPFQHTVEAIIPIAAASKFPFLRLITAAAIDWNVVLWGLEL